MITGDDWDRIFHFHLLVFSLTSFGSKSAALFFG